MSNIVVIALGGFDHLKFLTRLSLSGNRLTNLIDVLPQLKHMKQLDNLDLFNNPIAEEVQFRLHVIHHLPSVQTLDRCRQWMVVHVPVRSDGLNLSHVLLRSLCLYLDVTRSERTNADRLYANLIKAGRIQSDRLRQPICPHIAFGHKWDQIRLHSGSADVVSPLLQPLIIKAKRIRHERARATRDRLLHAYGDAGEHDCTGAPLPVPHAARVSSDQRNAFWERIQLAEDIHQGMFELIPAGTSSIDSSTARDICTRLTIGRRPVPAAFDQMMEHTNDSSRDLVQFEADLVNLAWEPVDHNSMVHQRDQLYEQAKEKLLGEDQSAAEMFLVRALSVERLIDDTYGALPK